MARETVNRALADKDHRAELELDIPIDNSDKSNFNLAQFERKVTLQVDVSSIAKDGVSADKGIPDVLTRFRDSIFVMNDIILIGGEKNTENILPEEILCLIKGSE